MAERSQAELVELVDRLRREPDESEWLEFKGQACAPQEIGEYFSALANSAALKRKLRGYLVFGVENRTHRVVGSSFDPNRETHSSQALLVWLAMGLDPRVSFSVDVVRHPDGRIVLFDVEATHDRPVRFRGTAHIRVGSSKTELSKHPQMERELWSLRTDWSALVCERARLQDLDPDAVSMARTQFMTKHPTQAEEANRWDVPTFLGKAKLTVGAAVTNAAVLLLGRPEAAAYLAPAVARISWVLRDEKNQERDYEHFGTPLILQVDRVLKRIRNLTLRAMPSGTLFPKEISQYDPWVIREALHNCIAHRDYGLAGRINVVETPTAIRLTNLGSFIPGSVERVIELDVPPEYYRNRFLAEAMVNLNMIDTQGGGIKRMFSAQASRYFPLPDYDLSQEDRVEVTIEGRILDERYTRLLMERSDLDLATVILLDKVQKHRALTDDELRLLRSGRLVEGRRPNLYVSSTVAAATETKADYIKRRAFDKAFYKKMVVDYLTEYGSAKRGDLDKLLMNKVSDALTPEQKLIYVQNLLQEMRRAGTIRIRPGGPRRGPGACWELNSPDHESAG
jgi:ATP-dependent DNA helicase RecG